MTSPAAAETIQIPPHPRILRALAEIDFDRWQCIAELVDNGFDEFLEMERADQLGDQSPRVHVALPKSADEQVVVSDNGRGMVLDRIKDAARAGYSGNDPLSKLGLFGMGFNVATARLGGVTTFLSTRDGDAEWVGVRIDVREMADDFSVPVVRLPKDDPTEHGTRIEISDLTQLALPFTDPTKRTRLRAQLGAIYSHLLDERGYELVVDQTPVTPYRHCAWSAERSVSRGARRSRLESRSMRRFHKPRYAPIAAHGRIKTTSDASNASLMSWYCVSGACAAGWGFRASSTPRSSASTSSATVARS